MVAGKAKTEVKAVLFQAVAADRDMLKGTVKPVQMSEM